MSLRTFFIPITILASVTAASFQPLSAHDEPESVPKPAAQTQAPPLAGAPPTGAPPQGEGRPRQGGERGEGGPRQRPEGGMGMQESPEQRQERTTRMLQPYLDILPDLSEDQKKHILVILEASNSEVRAVRANQTLPEPRRQLMVGRVRGFLPERISVALTEPQTAIYKASVAEQAAIQAEMDKVGSVRADEDVEQKRARLLQGYEAMLEELSVKQKTQIIKILEAAGEESAAIDADTKLTVNQKLEASKKAHEAVSAKVVPLLDKEQRESWKKAHDAKRPSA